MRKENEAYQWSIEPDTTWKPVGVLQIGDSKPRFVSDEQDDDRIRIRYFRDEDKGEVWAHCRLGIQTQGPPGHAHGGCVAAILDEAMGMVCWHFGHAVVAKSLHVHYKAPAPIRQEHIIQALLNREDEKYVYVDSYLKSADQQTTYSHCEGVFRKMDERLLAHFRAHTKQAE